MAHPRPRRAARPALAVRIARIGVPGLVVAGLATGTAAAVWPDHQLTAEPGTTPSVMSSSQPSRSDRPDRGSARSALDGASSSAKPSSAASSKKASASASASAASASAERAAAEKKAAEKKAAEKKAAEKKAAEKKAAEKKAAEKKAAEKKALADFAELGDSDGSKYTTSEVNVRLGAGTGYDSVDTVDEGDKVKVTDRHQGGWSQVVLDGKGRWIRSDLLTKKKPAAPKSEESSKTDDSDDSDSGGISGASCSSGSSVENGLTPDAIKVHRAICAKFPQVTSFGGVRADSMPEHPSGRALDSMISDSSVGWQIANWARAHHQELGISQVIYSQQIWTVQRSSEGWRSMPDRGSTSANHYDHVHVTVYGNSAG